MLWRVATFGSVPAHDRQAERGQARQHRLVERGDAVVVEAAGHRAEHRHLVGPLAERLAVALHLLGDVAQRVGGALAVELVDRDELGEVEHVDLLELAGGAELRRHHVDRHVDQRHDRGVALADARGLDDRRGRSRPTFTAASTSGRAALISEPKSRVASERMKTRGPSFHGAIAFMRMRSPSSAPPLLRRDGSIEITAMCERVALVEAQAPDQLVGEARLARAAGAGDADDRRLRVARRLAQLGAQRRPTPRRSRAR